MKEQTTPPPSECGDPSEWKRRAVDMAMAIFGTDEERKHQERLHELGNTLAAVRRNRLSAIADVASQVGCQPDLLCYLESGMGTKEEFTQIITRWTTALGIDSKSFEEELSSL